MSSAEQIEALIQSIQLSSIATVVTDPRQADNPIIAANAAFEELTGYSRPEILGRNCRFLRGPDTEVGASDMLRRAVADARAVVLELLNYRRDGSAFRNAVMIAPIFDDEGQLALFIGSQMALPDRAPPLEAGRREQARSRIEALTTRQRQVLRLMARGLLNKQIAFELGISEKTVKMHRAALLMALDAGGSADAIRVAVEAGL
jgi:PAS domain S-box-containing protein